MIHVTLSGAVQAPDIVLEVPHARIFGGTVWDRLELGVIATYVEQRWVRRGVAYQWMLFEGHFRLLFGLLRDPFPISQPLNILTVCGPMMYLNEAPFAEYVPTMAMWRGTADSRIWWPSFHLIGADFVQSDEEASERSAGDRGPLGFIARGGSQQPPSA